MIDAEEVAQTVLQVYPDQGWPLRRDLAQGQCEGEALDITCATSELGYAPRVSLEEGIKRYADWLRQRAR